MSMLGFVLGFIVPLGILVFVHELGHFLLAKWAGVGVLKFSLGFGPKLVGVKKGETEYLISALPLGGYVKMIGEDPSDESPEAADPARSFSQKRVSIRSLIILAGPVANFLLPVLIFWGIFTFVGQAYLLPVVGSPEKGSPAAREGVLAGDRMQALDGQRIERWDEVEAAVRASSGRPMALTILRDGKPLEVSLKPEVRRTLDIFGQEIELWDLCLHPFRPARIGDLQPGMPAQQAGLRTGDRITAVSDVPVADWDELAKTIHANPGRPVRLSVERDGQTLKVEVTPRPTRQQGPTGEEEIGLIGIIMPAPEFQYRRLNPATAFVAGAGKTVDLSVLVVQGLVKLVQGKISPKTIGGPILIGQMGGQVAQRGAVELFSFIALLSINLAILNLLPIPILDGGHLFFSLIEWLRGKPVSLRKREIAQQVGMVLLIGLMAFAFYNDIFRLLGWQ
jgi:regulator of sigma E protease